MSLLKSAKGLLFGTGGKTTNAYQAPNLDFLKESAPQVNYDFLKDYATSAPQSLTGNAKTYLDYLTPKTSNEAFQSYVGNINAPSSVDAVRSEVNNQALQNTLGDINRATNQKFGSTIMEQYLRGLTGGGAASDIAGNALAQVAAEGGRTAADAYTKLALGNLDVQKQREDALRQAYGQQYQGALSADQQAGNLAAGAAGDINQVNATAANLQGNYLQQYAQGLTTNASNELQRRTALANALNNQAASYASAEKPGTYGLLGTFANSYVEGLGKRLSGGGIPAGK